MTKEELEKAKEEFDNSPHYELWHFTFVIPAKLQGKHITNATLQELCEKYGRGEHGFSVLKEYADKNFLNSCDYIYAQTDWETDETTVFMDGIFLIENGKRIPVCYSNGFIPSDKELNHFHDHYDWYIN